MIVDENQFWNVQVKSPLDEADTRAVLAAIESAGYELRKVGTPIKPEEVQKGDWIRVQYEDGEEFRYLWNSDARYRGERGVSAYFLLDRPAPALPAEPGVRFRARGNGVFSEASEFITTDDDECQYVRLADGTTWGEKAFDPAFEHHSWTVIEVIG